MREPRRKEYTITKAFPRNTGLKPTKIELYPASKWSDKFGPNSPERGKCAFFWKGASGKWVRFAPLKSSGTDKLYRLAVNEKWYREDGYQYSFFTELKAYELLRNA